MTTYRKFTNDMEIIPVPIKHKGMITPHSDRELRRHQRQERQRRGHRGYYGHRTAGDDPQPSPQCQRLCAQRRRR